MEQKMSKGGSFMNAFIRHLCVLTIMGVLSVLTLAQATTLTMRNGQVLSGTYQGGTQSTIRFEGDSTIQEYPVAKVLTLNFGDTTASQTSQQNLLSLPAGKQVMIDNNGQFLIGSYQGGTKDTIRFQVENNITVPARHREHLPTSRRPKGRERLRK
jgi:hypothetical protein